MTARARIQPVITHAAAADLVASAIAHAGENGWTVAAVVVDPSGHVVASGRMDGAPHQILDFATDKAFTATLGKPSHAFGERMLSAPDIGIGLANRPRLCGWGGGVPIREDGALIGAIGVSGAESHEDIACAEAALAGQDL